MHSSNVDNAVVYETICMDGKSRLNKANAYTVMSHPGDKLGEITAKFVTCKPNNDKPDKYTQADKIIALQAAELNQTITREVDTTDLILKDSIAHRVKADSGVEFSNSVIDSLTIGGIKRMTNCKIGDCEIKAPSNRLKLYDKIQIDNLALNDNDARIFAFPKTAWGVKQDNYIKNIIVKNYSFDDKKPVVRIQGDIGISTIEFKEGPGIVKLTRSESEDPKKNINVINGVAIYDSPEEEVPLYDDLDI